MKSRLLCLPLLVCLLQTLCACDGKNGRPEPVNDLALQGTPAPTPTVGPIQTATPHSTPGVGVSVAPEPTTVPSALPAGLPTVAPAVTPAVVPSPPSSGSPTEIPKFPKSEIGLRLAPGIVAPIDGTGCDAVKLSTGLVATVHACTNDFMKFKSVSIGIFWMGTWVGTLGDRVYADAHAQRPLLLLRNSMEPGVVQFGATFNIQIPGAPVAQNSEVTEAHSALLFGRVETLLFLIDSQGDRHANLAYSGAGSPRRTFAGSRCSVPESDGRCPARESIVYAAQGQGKIGDLVVFRTLGGKDKAFGFITGSLFDTRLRKEHGIQAIPWITETP